MNLFEMLEWLGVIWGVENGGFFFVESGFWGEGVLRRKKHGETCQISNSSGVNCSGDSCLLAILKKSQSLSCVDL